MSTPDATGAVLRERDSGDISDAPGTPPSLPPPPPQAAVATVPPPGQKSLRELTKEVERDFFNRSDRQVQQTCEEARANLNKDTLLVIRAFMLVLRDVGLRDLAEAGPVRVPEIGYVCPTLSLGTSRDNHYLNEKTLYATVYDAELADIAHVLRYKVRAHFSTATHTERSIEVIVRKAPKTRFEQFTTLPFTCIIEVFLVNVSTRYPCPPTSQQLTTSRILTL